MHLPSLRPSSPSTLSVLACTAALALSGCGPALIGTGIGVGTSNSGGGSRTEVVSSPALTVSSSVQSQDDRTEITWRIAEADAWIAITYEVAGVHGPRSISGSSLVDGSGQPIAPGGVLANGWLVWDVAQSDTSSQVAWLHSTDLGRTEQRGVTLRIHVARAGQEDAAAFVTTLVPLPRDRVGREPAQLTLRPATQEGGPESRVTFDGELTDWGGDGDLVEFDVDWRALGSQGTTAWAPLARTSGRAPDLFEFSDTQVSANPGEPVIRNLRFAIDVLDPDPNAGLGIARMTYSGIEFRVRHREVHAAGTGFGSKTLPEQTEVVSTGTIALGEGPDFLGRPEMPELARFLVPIRFRLRNPSARFDSTFRVTGTYSFDDGVPVVDVPMTLARSDDVTLAPGDTEVYFAVWDARADLGLGLDRNLNFQATVQLHAELVETGVGDRLAGASSDSGGRTVATEPFASFGTLLTNSTEVMWQQPPSASAEQRLFTTGYPDPATRTGNEIKVDQQFLAIQEQGLQPFDMSSIEASPCGTLMVIPTTFVPQPNCIALTCATSNLVYIEWSDDQTTPGQILPVTEQVSPFSFNGRNISPDQAGLQFNLPNGQAGIMFFTYTPTADQITTHTTRVGGAPGAWSGIIRETVDEPIHPPYFRDNFRDSNWFYRIYSIDGDFDLDPNTRTIVLADSSCFHDDPIGEPLGHLDVVSFDQVGGSLTKTQLPNEGMEIPVDAYITEMRLAEWRDHNDPNARTGLVMGRGYFDQSAGKRVFEFFTLTQRTDGTWDSSWKRLTPDPVNPDDPLPLGQLADLDNYKFGTIYSQDLDGDGKQDLLAQVRGRDYITSLSGGRGVGEFDIFGDNKFRYLLTTDITDAGARAFVREVGTGTDLFELVRNDNDPRVWREVSPDVGAWVSNPVALEVVVEDANQQEIAKGPFLTGAGGRLNLWILANPSDKPAVWRRVFTEDLEASKAAEQPAGCTYSAMNITNVFDVNGDESADLVLHQANCVPNGGGTTQPFDDRHIYFASALAGVAEGVETDFGATIDPCRRPAVLDANADGIQDMISRGALYIGQIGGTFTSPGVSGFVTGDDAEYWVEEILPPDPAATVPTLNVLAYSTGAGIAVPAKIDTLELGDSLAARLPKRGATTLPLTVPSGSDVVAAMPVVRDPDMVPSQGVAKDLLAVVDDGAGDLRAFRMVESGSEFVVADPLPPTAGTGVSLIRDLAVARVGAVPDHQHRLRNEVPQDAFVATSGPAGEVLWLAHDDSTGPYLAAQAVCTAGAQETIKCIETGLVDGDDLEDLTIVTREDGGAKPVIHVYVLPQQAAAPRFDASTCQEVMRFEVEPQSVLLKPADPTGFGVDPFANGHANGVLVSNTEIRVLRPVAGPAGTRYTLLRSPIKPTGPINTALQTDVGVFASDFNLDGIPEVVGGAPGAPGVGAIFRVVRDDQL